MNILFITDLYPIVKNEEGIPKTLKGFVDVWKKWGHNVVVIRPNLIPNVLVRSRKIQKEGIYDVKGVKVYNRNYWFTNFGNFNFLEEKDFDVIVAHMPVGILFGQKLKDKLGCPLVCGVHASDIKVLTNWKYKKFFGESLKKAFMRSNLMALRSYWLKDKIERALPELSCKAFVAFSGINAKNIMPKEEVLSKFQDWEKAETVKFVTVGSFIKRKNIHLILKALSFVKSRKWQLDVIGKGPMSGKFKSLVRELDIEERVNFIGQIPNKQVYEYLRKAHVFLLPSINETFGLVYFEAMASGCLTLCAKDSGVDGIIQNNVNGITSLPTLDQLYSNISGIFNLKQDEIDKLMSNTYETILNYTLEKAALNYLEKIDFKGELKKLNAKK